jgi:hypothetical protein
MTRDPTPTPEPERQPLSAEERDEREALMAAAHAGQLNPRTFARVTELNARHTSTEAPVGSDPR